MNRSAFKRWYRDRVFRENIREGKEYYNGPSPVPPTDRHSPSSLLQCHRKLKYRQENAPEETRNNDGILWLGNQIEQEIYLPFLQDTIADEETYIRNSMWIDVDVQSNSGTLEFRGVTDPVVVDREGIPLLPTELKSTKSLEYRNSPSPHHRAQLHAYLYGLSENYDRQLTDGMLVYVSRETLELRAFHIEFDREFWEETVVDWAATHTEYRLNDHLPPANPEFKWECKFCSYRERCGNGSGPYADLSSDGFVPGVDYPREKILQYIQSRDGAKLTPTLAAKFPEIADRIGVAGWKCPSCLFRAEQTASEWLTEATQPLCPRCADEGSLVELEVPHGSDTRSTQ